ncbi:MULTISPECIES: phospholipase D-like domain-containing protein [Paraburkholderia]|uniref:Phospholipase D-like domain-containing protein n=1 Tax=Paraburkholderia acidicola TaxID=1912599 RepID=A0ABV1LYH4_9BURK
MVDCILKSQNPAPVSIDEQARTADSSAQWFLETEKDPDLKPTSGNDLQFFVCGEEGFRQIATDIMSAQSTVDLVCWGFDPGMELWRGPGAPEGVGEPYPKKTIADLEKMVLGNSGVLGSFISPVVGGDSNTSCPVPPPRPVAWPRGVVYGALLEEITLRQKNPVTVRLLIWFDPRGSRKQNNMPGFSDIEVSKYSSPAEHAMQAKAPYSNPARNQYSIDWWKRNLPDGESKRSGIGTKNPRLQIVLRSIKSDDVTALMKAEPPEEDAPSTHRDWADHKLTNEENLIEDYATHHQKPILIDYSDKDGVNAKGYVMGFNSVTDYWDRTAHEIDDPLREEWVQWYIDDELKHEQETQAGPPSTAAYKHTNPYQDYGCRVVGKALKRLHQNFERSWKVFAPPEWKKGPGELATLPPMIPNNGPDDAAHQVQIVRTQPTEHEKTIKKLYYQATSWARGYIYMENQYFFYPEFARHLKTQRKSFLDKWSEKSGKPQQEAPMLHLFVVTPHPEDPGMVPRTYDTMAELGHGDAMKAQGDLTASGGVDRTYKSFHVETLDTLKKTYGLKVSIARLRTSGMVGNQLAYREIYIHSKLIIIDDVFVMLGSANMNQRSMTADSEINIAVQSEDSTTKLRGRIFDLLSGGATSGGGSFTQVSKSYDDWEKRMHDNLVAKMTGQNMSGFILPFEDHRAETVLHAQIDLPSSSNIPTTA